ncbi:MAG: type 4a pilus biogenesis protein PilO [Thermoanaerobaculia bacterium]
MKGDDLLSALRGHPRGVAASLAVLIALVSLAFSVLPRSVAAYRLESRVRRSAALERDGGAAPAPEVEVQEIEEGWGQLRRVIPLEPDISGLTEELTSLSQRAAVLISDIQTGQPERIGSFVRTPLVLSFRGRARAVCEFLEGEKRLERLVGIEALEVQVLDDGGLQVRSTLAAYSGGN